MTDITDKCQEQYRKDSGRLTARLKDERPYAIPRAMLDTMQRIAQYLGYGRRE